MKKVLILGGSGLVGNSLIKELSSNYDIYATYDKHNINLNENKKLCVNINNSLKLINFINDIKPHLIISCLRGDFKTQYTLHIDIANAIKNKNTSLYFCSTANVFDEDPTIGHYEDETPHALSDYGKFKIKCEKDLTSILNDRFHILRLPEIWGKNSPRFNNLISNLKSNNTIEVYSNYYKTTNLDVILAKQIHYIIDTNLNGTFHLCSTDIINNYDFIYELAKRLGFKNANLKRVKIEDTEKYHLAIQSKRCELPNEIQITNKDIINYLTN